MNAQGNNGNLSPPPLFTHSNTMSSINLNNRGPSSVSSSRKQSLSVKLTKTSSARPLLYSKTHREALHRLVGIIQEGDRARQETSKGKLPVEAAYIVMKRVTESAGLPILPTGLSTFNKLNSLRTEPALEVLKKNTWRDFFKETDPASNNSMISPGNPAAIGSRPTSADPFRASSSFSLNNGQRGGRLPSPSPANRKEKATSGMRALSRPLSASSRSPTIDDEVADPNEMYQLNPEDDLRMKSSQLLNELGEIMIERILNLWKKLKIPRNEQTFYEKSLCCLPITSYEQCKELSKLLYILQQHEISTKKVLSTINEREKALQRTFEILNILARKLFHEGNNNHRSGNNTPNNRLVSASSSPFRSQQNSSSNNASFSSQQQYFWKEELLLSLQELRVSSIEVIKTIQDWRRSLWRPLSFIWKGKNYLMNMKDDVESLYSLDLLKKIVDMIPLKLYDLQGILFLSNEQFNSLSSAGSPGSPSARPPTGASSAAGRNGGRDGGSVDQYQEYLKSLISSYQQSFDFFELQSAILIVNEEESLQNAIKMEQYALTMKGVFIPMLKPFNDLSNSALVGGDRGGGGRGGGNGVWESEGNEEESSDEGNHHGRQGQGIGMIKKKDNASSSPKNKSNSRKDHATSTAATSSSSNNKTTSSSEHPGSSSPTVVPSFADNKSKANGNYGDNKPAPAPAKDISVNNTSKASPGRLPIDIADKNGTLKMIITELEVKDLMDTSSSGLGFLTNDSQDPCVEISLGKQTVTTDRFIFCLDHVLSV
jgi:hypothetical protein